MCININEVEKHIETMKTELAWMRENFEENQNPDLTPEMIIKRCNEFTEAWFNLQDSMRGVRSLDFDALVHSFDL